MTSTDESGRRPVTEAARLSKLLFEARELVSMFCDVVEGRTGKTDDWSRRVRDEIDSFRAERGWSAHGFGGEQPNAIVRPTPLRIPEDRHPGTRHFERMFAFDHLPEGILRETSARFSQLAQRLVDSLPDGPELTAGLRKLLEAKDCCVRACLGMAQ